MIRLLPRSTTCLLAGVVMAGCTDAGPTDASVARVQVLLTDAPSDYITAADVWISHVYLMRGGLDDEAEGTDGDDGAAQDPRVDLFNDAKNPLQYDLLQLRDGITADLTDLVDIPEGTYGGLRLVVDRAMVTLAEGVFFRDGTSTAELKVPSGSRSGLKVKLAEIITAEAGTTTIVTVDFDVDQNFKLQGNPASAAGLNGVIFTPSLRELNREENGNGGS